MPINADVCGEKNTRWHDDGDDDGDDDCRYMQMFVLRITHGGMMMQMFAKNTWWYDDGEDDDVMVMIADVCRCLC